MKTLKSILFSLMAITMVTVFLSSCEKGEETVIESQKQFNDADNQRIKELLCINNNDECTDNLVFTDNSVMVGSCMHMHKSQVLDYLENDEKKMPVTMKVLNPENPNEEIEIKFDELNERAALYMEDEYTAQNLIHDVRYFILNSIKSSSCGGGYESEIVEAANKINSVVGCRINMIRTWNINDADIVLGCDTDIYFSENASINYGIDQYNYIALATWPTNRGIGKYISVDEGSSVPSDVRVGLMIHELLHNLGLDHMDHPNIQAFELADTPMQYGDDPESVMMLNIANIGGNDLSEHDKDALRRVWPHYIYTPENFSVTRSGNTATLTFKNPYQDTRPYDRVNVVYYYKGSYQTDIIYTQPDASGNYTYTWTGLSPGRNYFYVRGGSHNNEVLTGGTSWRYVNK